MKTKQTFSCTCCTTVAQRIQHLEQLMRTVKGIITQQTDRAERTEDEARAQSHLRAAQGGLRLYRHFRTEHTTLLTTTFAECPTCGMPCDWETYRNVDSCYRCYRNELDGAIPESYDPLDVFDVL